MTASYPGNQALVRDRVPPLRALRVAHGYSLEAAAKGGRLDPAHLSRVERGLSGLSVDSLARLAKLYGLVELEKLLAPYTRDGVTKAKQNSEARPA